MRPLLFVVHSLGGIVVKEMLRKSDRCHKGQDHLRDVFFSTTGVIFFGTPHGGADPRGILHHAAESFARAVGFTVNNEILSSLLPSSEHLRELRDDFSPLAHNQEWTIHSFQEELGMKSLRGRKVRYSPPQCVLCLLLTMVSCQVVDDNSSYLNFPAIETTEHIGRNHRDMCRFSGPDDPEYKKVAAALRRITTSPSKKHAPAASSSLTGEQNQKLRTALGFDQIDARQLNIKSAHTDTCKWLNGMQEYRDWLDPSMIKDHHGFLWIKGKPGTGKSTLMKFALAQARESMTDAVIISFFFNARGGDLEKSTNGMYRSLLLQLVKHVPELGMMIYTGFRLESWSGLEGMQWTIETLKDLLAKGVQLLTHSNPVFFIDALDECDEDEVRDMISFFEQLGESAVEAKQTLHICFSSRHYPHVTVNHAQELVLEGQEGHNKDITNYINSELKIGQSKIADELRSEIRERASGVFLWVALVVGILNKEYDRGRMLGLRKRLHEIPTGLHELFHDILLRDVRDTDELVFGIQLLLLSQRPLRPAEFYFGVLAHTDPQSFEIWDKDIVTQSTLRRFVLDCSKGLADVTTSRRPVVQFIHESVRDFLLRDNGLQDIWPGAMDDFEGESHERLKKLCMRCVTQFVESPHKTRLSLKPSERVARENGTIYVVDLLPQQFPFVNHCITAVLYHSDQAEAKGISQLHFLQEFNLASWLEAVNARDRLAYKLYPPETDILRVVAGGGLSHLVGLCLSMRSPSQLSSVAVEAAFLRAVLSRRISAALVLARFEAARQSSPPTLFQRLCEKYIEDPYRIPDVGSWTVPSEEDGVEWQCERISSVRELLDLLRNSPRPTPEWLDAIWGDETADNGESLAASDETVV